MKRKGKVRCHDNWKKDDSLWSINLIHRRSLMPYGTVERSLKKLTSHYVNSWSRDTIQLAVSNQKKAQGQMSSGAPSRSSHYSMLSWNNFTNDLPNRKNLTILKTLNFSIIYPLKNPSIQYIYMPKYLQKNIDFPLLSLYSYLFCFLICWAYICKINW